LNIVFTEIEEELAHMDCGTLIVQIREDRIGKFGLRHDPFFGKGGQLNSQRTGMSEQLRYEFRQMAVRSLQHKKKWTHGEILFDFRIKQGILHTSIQFESNYNLAKLKLHSFKHSD